MKVFISYTWESGAHGEWVERLASRLRSDGIETTLDKWELKPGDDFLKFMEEGIRDHDHVLVICTPEYKRKADERRGGAGYETRQISAEIFYGLKPGKFIPVLRSGERENAVPSCLQGILDINMTDDSKLPERYVELLGVLSGQLKEAPPVGIPQDMRKFDDLKMSFLQDRLMGRAFKCGIDDIRYTDGLVMDRERLEYIKKKIVEHADITGTKYWITYFEKEEFDQIIKKTVWTNGEETFTFDEAEIQEIIRRCARGLEFRLGRMFGAEHIQSRVMRNGDIAFRYIK